MVLTSPNVLRRQLWPASLPSLRSVVPEGQREEEREGMDPSCLVDSEIDGVNSSLAELDLDAPELEKRMYEVLRMRVHMKGDFLHESLTNVHQGVQNTDTTSVIFAHPLGSLSKLPMQILVLTFGLYFIPGIVDFFIPIYLDETRHIRFSTLEMRVPQATDAGVGISRLSLLLGRSPDDPLRPGIRSRVSTYYGEHDPLRPGIRSR